jgi:hypothetical protein
MKMRNVQLTTSEIASRFMELAREERWFAIQDELFDEEVRSIEPEDSPWLATVAGRAAVRKKGEEWVGKIEAVNWVETGEPMVAGNHFVIRRLTDVEIRGIGRVVVDQLMVYEVKAGRIISERFFY